MDPTEVTPIVQLRPYTKADKIGVRVCRIWKSSVPGTVQKYVNLHCILVDEMNHAVEAFTKDIDYEVIASKIEAGSSYEIMNFRTIKIRGQDKVVAHETQIMLTATTLFKKLSNVFLPISRHNFFLQDYNSLYPRLNKVDILTGRDEAFRPVFGTPKMGGTSCSTRKKLGVFASHLPPLERVVPRMWNTKIPLSTLPLSCSLLLHHKPNNPNASLPSNPDEFELDFGLSGLNVIEHLTTIQHLEQKQINQRKVQKCDVRIENIRLSFRSHHTNST
ncbi:hypothetical protein DVH24_028203 [Malus domestica]|uniref:Replication protein A 70 kDa DNA-binding subunit B/D first OB fold domain-containing protein n=1 Tax=Malus domestica TaxID=3750 RepID=A0A498H9F3_MALDO|nr:hypothetical protein DVH24_028203 [Malus domestica]